VIPGFPQEQWSRSRTHILYGKFRRLRIALIERKNAFTNLGLVLSLLKLAEYLEFLPSFLQLQLAQTGILYLEAEGLKAGK
jgi:hypothetical protein